MQRQKFKTAARTANRTFRQETYHQAAVGLDLVLLNWLIPFLQVWGGEAGSFRCEKGRLSIYQKCDRTSQLSLAMKFNIYLDATLTASRLGLTLGIAPTCIMTIEQETPSYSNLTVCQVAGLGKLGKQRSDSLKERVEVITHQLLAQHGNIAFLDWKNQGETLREMLNKVLNVNAGQLASLGCWFVDSRGSNAFINTKAICSFGIPYQNIGDLAAQYQVLTGRYINISDKDNPDLEFQAWVDAHVEAEIVQSIGRLRAHLRSEQQLTYYFCGNYDLSFLKDVMPGVDLSVVESFNINPKAGTDTQKTRWVVLEAFRQLTKSGTKITQTALAKMAEISQGRISQIASEFGGWRTFKKLLMALLIPSNNVVNNLDDPEGSYQWLAQTYLPMVVSEEADVELKEAVLEIVEILEIYGWSVFQAIIGMTDLLWRAKLLAMLMGMLPEYLQQGFLRMQEVT